MDNKPKLYYFYTSYYSQKTLMFLHEKGIDFDTQVINLPGEETKTPWYLAINPKGEVPAMKHGQNIINGSDEILEYIEKYNIGTRSLYPADPSEKKKHEFWMSQLVPLPIGPLTYGIAYNPHLRQNQNAEIPGAMFPRMRNTMDNRSANLRQKAAESAGTPAEAVLFAKAAYHDKQHYIFTSEVEYNRMLREMNDMMDEVEVELGTHRNKSWLIGNTFTASDCILAICLRRLYWIGHENYVTNDSRPLLKKYWYRLQSRDSFIKSTYYPNLSMYMIKEQIKKKTPTILNYVLLPLTVALAYYIYNKMI